MRGVRVERYVFREGVYLMSICPILTAGWAGNPDASVSIRRTEEHLPFSPMIVCIEEKCAMWNRIECSCALRVH